MPKSPADWNEYNWAVTLCDLGLLALVLTASCDSRFKPGAKKKVLAGGGRKQGETKS